MSPPSYVDHHERYWRQVAEIRRWLDAAHGAVQRLERLNAAVDLGLPVSERAIAEFYVLHEYASGCPMNGIGEDEPEGSSCPVCGIEAGAVPPERRARAVLRSVQSGLRRQVSRIASGPVRERLTGESGQAVESLVRALEAGHIAAAMLVLDDELLGEIEQSLNPAAARLTVLEQLQRLHPLVRDWEVDLAVETFRRLLVNAIDGAGKRGEPAEVRLADQARLGGDR